ncbi:MAG: cyclic nucleotide-binding domain-containing protein [Proteobacteria bacterium]|nr:cyclic nucleotide-binding domain-containing protein [Pseudomonadota bacterium]
MIEPSQKLVKDFGRQYKQGTVLFHEGDRGKEWYIIERGAVQISKEIHAGKKVITTLDDGDFFGEMVLFTDTARTATATVIEDSTIVVISEETFNNYVLHDASILYLLLNKVCQRLKDTTDELVKQMK